MCSDYINGKCHGIECEHDNSDRCCRDCAARECCERDCEESGKNFEERFLGIPMFGQEADNAKTKVR